MILWLSFQDIGLDGKSAREREDERSAARGRRKETAAGGKGQPASGSFINYKAAVECLESAHSGIRNKEDKK